MTKTDRYTIGVDAGGTKVAFGLFDSEHRIVERDRIDTALDCSAEELLDQIATVAKDMVVRHGISLEQLDGVGVGFPSMIDLRSGYIIITSAIPELKEVAAQSILQKHFTAPVTIGNDGHCGALAEHAYGAGRGFDNMLYIPFSTGISSAIILDGELHRGSFGSAGESGHAIATPDKGVLCGCGNRGCFMSYISGRYIVEHIKNWLAEGEPSSMVELADNNPDNIDGRVLAAAYQAGDPMAIKAIRQMIHYMGYWLFNLYMTFNVDCFVFGGGLVNLGDAYFKPLREEFEKYLVAKPLGEIHFKYAELKDDFGIIGAEQLIHIGK